MTPFPNFRDLGSRATDNGRKIRPGLLYRSGQFGKLTNNELRSLVSMGIRTVVDLRSARDSSKCRDTGPRITMVCLPIELEDRYRKRVRPLLYRRKAAAAVASAVESLYVDLVSDEKPTIARLYELLASRDRYPILVHCRAGQDRTGFVTAVVLLSLGVDKTGIVADYLLSIGYSVPRVRTMARVMKGLTLGLIFTKNFEAAFTAHERNIRAVFTEIETKYGTVEKYLESCGVSEEQLASFRKIVLG
jgi:protein-tyrosine phosphatase